MPGSAVNERSIAVIIVAFRNDPSQVAMLADALAAGARAAGGEPSICLVVNDEQDYSHRPDQVILSGHGNIGFGRAVNLGLRAVSGNCVLIVNPDCATNESSVKNFLESVSRNPGITVPILVDAADNPDYDIYESWVYTPTRRVSAVISRRFLSRGQSSTLPRFMKAPGTFLGMSRDTAEKLGPFNDHYFLYGEDRDLSFRARKLGVPLILDRSTRVFHEGGHSGRTVSALVARSKFDSALRIAYEHRGPIGLVLLTLNLLVEALAREALGKRGVLADLLWSARRWRAVRPAAPLTEEELRKHSRTRNGEI